MFRGTFRVSNFVVTNLHVRNCIPSIKLLAISMTAKLEFSFIFLEQIKVVWVCTTVLSGFPILL